MDIYNRVKNLIYLNYEWFKAIVMTIVFGLINLLG